MTKKSKRRALKTGSRDCEEPRNTTVTCGINVNLGPNDQTTLPLESEEVDSDENENVQLKNKLTRHQKNLLKEQKQCEVLAIYQKENSKRHVYPIDLWFLLSQKIEPEQVKLFSLICKDAYHVITTRKFWLELYKRYTTDYKTLPCHLMPKAITTNIGLKARVVRSLYHCYAPFKENVSHSSPVSLTLENAENKACQCYWWRQATSCKRNTTVWILHFKLFPPGKRRKSTNIFKVKELIRHNPEEDCCLLRLTSTSFVNITDVTELHLTSVGVGVSRDMQHHRAKLTFHEYRKYGKYTNTRATVLVIDPVLDIHVLPWWDPEYPHPLDN